MGMPIPKTPRLESSAWGIKVRVPGGCTIQTEIAETQDSGSVCDDSDVDFVGGMFLQDLIDPTLVLQGDVQTLGIDINMRKSLACLTDNWLSHKLERVSLATMRG